MGSADAIEVPLMDLKVPEGLTELSLKMKSEYGCQFSNVDPKLCELIYEANRHFRIMRRKHEYEHTPFGNGWKPFEEVITDVYEDAPYATKIGRRANSTERPLPRNRRYSRRPSSAERAFSAEPRMLNGFNNYEDYLNKNDEPRLSPKYASVQNKARNSINRPKVRIRLPPFVAYGGGCSSREFGDMKTYNVNAANHVPKTTLRTSKPRVIESEDGTKIVYRPMTGSWLPRDVIPDWKTEYRSNYCL